VVRTDSVARELSWTLDGRCELNSISRALYSLRLITDLDEEN
jgi:hypothetical protein